MTAWNKEKRIGWEKAFKLEEVLRVRIRFEIEITPKTQQCMSQWVYFKSQSSAIFYIIK